MIALPNVLIYVGAVIVVYSYMRMRHIPLIAVGTILILIGSVMLGQGDMLVGMDS